MSTMQMLGSGFLTAGSVSALEIPKEVIRLAEALAPMHGAPTIVRESGGYHIYLASPKCLELHGAIELEKKHLAVNASKYCGIGPKWLPLKGTYDRDLCAMCMKYDTPYRVSTLLDFKPISERGFPDADLTTRTMVKEKYLIDDGAGHMIPDHPGMVTPITEMAADHPAVVYLLERRYNLDTLWRQFRCSYCYLESPEMDVPVKRRYRKLPGGWKDTPQGRIIFYADIKGVQVSWQGRVIDKIVGDCWLYWHPYSMRWDLVKIRIGRDANGKDIWRLVPPFDTAPPYTWNNPKWDPSKYMTARDSERNTLIMGLDAAVEWNKVYRPSNPIGVGCEGPLDAGKLGPPGVAIIGKFLSENQAKLLKVNFREFVYVADSDQAGRDAAIRVKDELGPKLKLHVLTLKDAKDLGEYTPDAAYRLLYPFLKG